MTRAFQRVTEQLWRGKSPYAGFPEGLYAHDIRGWNSDHDYLPRSIAETPAGIALDVGVWKGGSTLAMAREIRNRGLDGAVIAIDTFLGSSEHWLRPEWSDQLAFEHGQPQLYRIFLGNVLHEHLEDVVVPFPLDSANAAIVLHELGVSPSVVHVDAAHDYEAASADILRWWRLLRPDGYLVVDDYDPETSIWPEVNRAVDDFVAAHHCRDFEAFGMKCRFRKPA